MIEQSEETPRGYLTYLYSRLRQMNRLRDCFWSRRLYHKIPIARCHVPSCILDIQHLSWFLSLDRPIWQSEQSYAWEDHCDTLSFHFLHASCKLVRLELFGSYPSTSMVCTQACPVATEQSLDLVNKVNGKANSTGTSILFMLH